MPKTNDEIVVGGAGMDVGPLDGTTARPKKRGRKKVVKVEPVTPMPMPELKVEDEAPQALETAPQTDEQPQSEETPALPPEGDYMALRKALLHQLQLKIFDTKTSARDLAPLSRQAMAIAAEIEAIETENGEANKLHASEVEDEPFDPESV